MVPRDEAARVEDGGEGLGRATRRRQAAFKADRGREECVAEACFKGCLRGRKEQRQGRGHGVDRGDNPSVGGGLARADGRLLRLVALPEVHGEDVARVGGD